jgi:hypothetical protein
MTSAFMARISVASASTGAVRAALIFQLATRRRLRAGVVSGRAHAASGECVRRSDSVATMRGRRGCGPGACIAMVSAVAAAAITSVETTDRIRPDLTFSIAPAVW